MEEKIKSLKLTATRLALFERRLGIPLTRITTGDLGIDAIVKLLEVAGLTEEEIDKACDELGLDKFCELSLDVLMNSGLFKQAKQARAKAAVEATKK